MRVVVNTVVLFVCVLLSVVISVIAFLLSPGRRLGAYVTRYWSMATLFLSGVKVKVDVLEGDRGIARGPALIVANHASMLDIMVMAVAVRQPFHFVSRPHFFKVPLLGWGMWLTGQLSLDPKKPRQAARALRGFSKRFESGLSVALFPEGTRSQDGTVATYKRGPFLTAIHHGVPILPVRQFGTHELFPKGTLILRPGTIRVVVGAPIPTEGLSPPDARALAKRVEDWTRTVEPPAG